MSNIISPKVAEQIETLKKDIFHTVNRRKKQGEMAPNPIMMLSGHDYSVLSSADYLMAYSDSYPSYDAGDWGDITDLDSLPISRIIIDDDQNKLLLLICPPPPTSTKTVIYVVEEQKVDK